MSTPELLYSDVEEDLRSSVHDLLADRCAPEKLLANAESANPYDLQLWATLTAELGTAGLPIPEHLGGQGASTKETALVLEELGRAVAPVPFLGSAVLATSTLLETDTAEPAVAELLHKLATGATTGALAVPLSTAAGSSFPTSVRAGPDRRLSGSVGTVADAAVADVLLVPATSAEGPALYAVETAADGVSISDVVSLDLTRRLADVALDSVASRQLAGPDQAPAALEHGLTVAAGLLASEQLGLAQWCLDETVRYLRQRYQFGRPVGSFQALKHRLADVYLELVSARAAARNAVDAIASASAHAPVEVSLAQSYCAEFAVHAAEECLQLHGGIGMTWEHPAHLYLKRAKSNEIALGTPVQHRKRLGELIDLHD